MSSAPLDPAAIEARRVLVVAPHPDDETLGCGGLLWHLARRGAAIHVAFVTDGGASHRNSATWPRARLAAAREEEAAEALVRLGLGAAARSFQRLRDADMPTEGTPAYDAAFTAAVAITDRFRPDLALLPWRRDPHRDHRDAFALFTRALARLDPAPRTMEYAIWLDEFGAPDDHPLPGEMERVDVAIGEAVEAKRRAVEAHRTQTGHVIRDDPAAFRLTEATIQRLVGPVETYWRPRP